MRPDLCPLLPSRRSPKRQHTGRVRMQCESVASQPLGQDIHHALRVVASLEADHKVLGISHERRPTTKTRSHDLVEPHVQRVVEIDVTQQRREPGPLCGAPVRRDIRLAVEHSHTQQLADESQTATILSSSAEIPIGRVRPPSFGMCTRRIG